MLLNSERTNKVTHSCFQKLVRLFSSHHQLKDEEISMNKFVKFFVVFVFVALFAMSATAQNKTDNSNNKPSDKPTTQPEAKKEEPKKEEKNPLLDKWELIISAPGEDLDGTLTLEKDGDNYKGSVMTVLGEAPLKNIKIKDNTFTSDITVNVQGQSIEGTMSGELKEGKLKGDFNLPGIGVVPYTGKKP
jgi:hypothetical protein